MLLCDLDRLYKEFQRTTKTGAQLDSVDGLRILVQREQAQFQKLLPDLQRQPTAAENSGALQNNRVLVIDDQDVIRGLYEAILSTGGKGNGSDSNGQHDVMEFELTTCAEGEEGYHAAALAIAEGHPYATAFIDIHMPGWDGLKTARKIRELDQDIRIVFVTADNQADLHQLHQAIPTNMLFLAKPIQAEAIYQMARTLCISWNHEQQRMMADRRLRKVAEQLNYQATHDPLTGLFNRRAFLRELDQIVERGMQEGERCYLLFLDLDQFKVINDTVGHPAGDEVLVEISNRIGLELETTDYLARLGGDEFGILVYNRDQEEMLELCEQIMESISGFTLSAEGLTFTVHSCIGITELHTGIELNRSEMLRQADLACYEAKESGRDHYHLYSPQSVEIQKRSDELRTVAQVHQAMNEGRLVLYAQPIVPIPREGEEAIENNQLHYEVLIRMLDTEGNLVPPDLFIPACEHYQLMPVVDRWVITESFRFLAKLSREGHRGGNKMVVVGINLSGLTVMDEDLNSFILEQQERYRIDSRQVYFEVTETTAIKRLERARSFLHDMRSYGFQFALDDFGTGMSSFSYLKKLPVDLLKIDGQFVTGLKDHDRIDRAMVESIQKVSEVMGMHSIAEYVEDQESFDTLQNIGVDYAQGFYCSPPKPIDEIVGLDFDMLIAEAAANTAAARAGKGGTS